MRRLGKVGLRILAGLGGLFVVLIALAVVFRLPLVAWALRHTLTDAGATNVAVTVTELSLRHLEIQPLGFAVGGQQVKIGKITLDRPAVFSGSLGRVLIEGVAATLDLPQTGSAAIPAQKTAEPPARNEPPLEWPFEQLQVEGHITLAFQDGSRVLSIDADAKPVSPSRIGLVLHAAAPGLTVDGRGEFDFTTQSGEATLGHCRFELKSWRELLAAYLPPEAAGWALDGTVTGDGHGKFEQGAVTGAAAFRWRDGAVSDEKNKASAAGLTADVTVELRQVDGRSRVQLEAALAGPGLSAKGHAGYDLGLQSGDFTADGLTVELHHWNDFLLAFAPAAAGFELGGTVTGDARGRVEKGAVTGSAALHLRDSSIHNAARGILAEGIAADLAFPDLPNPASAPNQIVRMARAQIGTVALEHGEVDLQIVSPELVTINAAAVQAFGGRVSTDPFQFNPALPALRVVLRMADIEAQQILKIFPDAPQGEGILAGRIPISYEEGRVAFGEGRLGLKPDTVGRIRFHNAGLFTQAWSWWMPGRKMIGQLETGGETFVVNEGTIDLHPPDTPERPARVRLVGVPAEHPRDGPFVFEFNINIPLETLVNFGLKQNMHFELN